MACRAAKSRVLGAVRDLGGDVSMGEIIQVVGWWTGETLAEAARELVSEGLLGCSRGHYYLPGLGTRAP
jgi:hypothetical protein